MLDTRHQKGPGDGDDVDAVLADLTADHDVERYPGGAVVAVFSPGGVADAQVRDPPEVLNDPYPYDTG